MQRPSQLGPAPLGPAIAIAITMLACRSPPIDAPDASPHAIEPATAEGDDAVDFGDAAFARLVALMALPRALGHPDRAASIDALADMLDAVGAATIERVDLTAHDPATGEAFALTNLVAHVRPHATRRFVLGTHFDTRPWADESSDPADHDRPVPGANDGTSGIAVVLELAARLPARLPDDVGFTIALFDGEELGRPGHGGYCVGSREVAVRMTAGELPILRAAELGIVLDMVGDADLQIPIEPGSLRVHPTLVDHVWATARRLGYDAFDPIPRKIGILDDHQPLSDAGVPSILVIDRDYPAWHTTGDTIERVSARSLHVVGETVLEAIASWYTAAAPG